MARPPIHGHRPRGKKRPTYAAWCSAKERCYNARHKKYPLYGGRGVRMCDRWRASFESFLADMGERPGACYSLDRFPNKEGNYEPGNCRWATISEQNSNKRTNTFITHGGETRTLSEWSRLLGWSNSGLRHRLARMPLAEALTCKT